MEPYLRIRNLWVCAGLMMLIVTAGCSIKVDKSKNGEDKDVSIQTPMGGLHVEQNQTTAADIGLAAYPGATMRKDEHDSDSANVQLGFGRWQLHVRAANYQSADPEAKVDAFYRSALARYGDVIECRGGKAVGAQTATHDGLSCEDPDHQSHGMHFNTGDHDYELRAGSKRHQHIVAIGTQHGQTQFALLQLDLPAGSEKSGGAE